MKRLPACCAVLLVLLLITLRLTCAPRPAAPGAVEQVEAQRTEARALAHPTDFRPVFDLACLRVRQWKQRASDGEAGPPDEGTLVAVERARSLARSREEKGLVEWLETILRSED